MACRAGFCWLRDWLRFSSRTPVLGMSSGVSLLTYLLIAVLPSVAILLLKTVRYVKHAMIVFQPPAEPFDIAYFLGVPT